MSMLNRYNKSELIYYINGLVAAAHSEALSAGWWKDVDINDVNVVPAKLCLIHSEISEAMEGDRTNAMDKHLPHRLSVEVELADAVIRIADLVGKLKLDLGGAVVEKIIFNRDREDHKPENRCKDNGKSY